MDKTEIEAGKKEVQRIREIDDTNLLDEFEGIIRNGAGMGYFKLKWYRREIINRMKYREPS